MTVQQERMQAAEDRLASRMTAIQRREDSIFKRIGRIGTGAGIRRVLGAPAPRRAIALPRITERIQGRDDIVSIEFLEAGLLAKRAICRLSAGAGTGFHVGLGLIMTAAHSLPSRAEASDTVAEFDVEEHRLGPPRQAASFLLHPERFYLCDPQLDIALCAAIPLDPGAPALTDYGWHVLADRDADLPTGLPISIIHHPDGRAKALSVHNAHIVDSGAAGQEARYCWYCGDTRGGSSGAPVFDPDWSVLALHQASVPLRDAKGYLLNRSGARILRDGAPLRALDQIPNLEEVGVHANEGTRAGHIVQALRRTQMAERAQQDMLEAVLQLWAAPGARHMAQRAAMQGLAGTRPA